MYCGFFLIIVSIKTLLFLSLKLTYGIKSTEMYSDIPKDCDL